MKKIGILTGGGDAPGLNGIIEAAGRALIENGDQVIGIQDGFDGIFHGKTVSLKLSDLVGLHTQPGTVLGTTNKSGITGRESEFIDAYKKIQLDGLIVAGGDGTFRGLQPFQNLIKMVGVPKTIDNDLSGTDITFGFDTACSVISSAVDSLRHSARAHSRVMVVEAMGRTAGWLALGGGLSSYADVILIPERPFQKLELLNFIKKAQSQGRRDFMIVVSEGAHPIGEDPQVAFHVAGSPQTERYGGVAQNLARWIEAETGWEARHVVLGHLQRSSFPTTTDRFLTMAMGVRAAQLVMANDWNKAAVYRQGQVLDAPLADLMGPARLVPSGHRWLGLVKALGIFH